MQDGTRTAYPHCANSYPPSGFLFLCGCPPASPQVAAEALRVCEQLVRVIRPDTAAPVGPAMQPLVLPLYTAVLARLAAQVTRVYVCV
jgi:hypothetical protein